MKTNYRYSIHLAQTFIYAIQHVKRGIFYHDSYHYHAIHGIRSAASWLPYSQENDDLFEDSNFCEKAIRDYSDSPEKYDEYITGVVLFYAFRSFRRLSNA